MADLVIALDYPDARGALGMAERLKGADVWMKVGLELFTAEGPSLISRIKDLGFKVFLDMKFFDIPNTVRGAVRSSVRHGVDMVNIHLMGGERMARAAMEGLHEGAAGSGASPILLGVTVLTSMSQEDLPKGFTTTLPETVLQLASAGNSWGIHGVVCSGHEVVAIKNSCGKGYLCLTPGIRPVALGDDQRRTMTPAEAVQAGSDFLVVGRPVTGSDDPAQAAHAILEAMKQA
jgi:orotidine-5'-phosphate decarboxylase